MKKHNKIFIGFLSLVAVLCMGLSLPMPKTAELQSEEAVGASTLSKSGGKYQISSANDLVKFSNDVNGGYSYDGETVVLAGDIDMSSVANFSPIGKYGYTFKGDFDGQGHTISNLKITNTNRNYVGLFGLIYASDDVTIEDFILKDPVITSTYDGTNYLGGVLGFCELERPSTINFNSCTIQNVAVIGESNSSRIASYTDTGISRAGGIVGGTTTVINGQTPSETFSFTEVLNIQFCWSDITLSAYGPIAYSTGGILANGYAIIENCYSLKNAIISENIDITNNSGLLYVKFCYDYISTRDLKPSSIVPYKYIFYTYTGGKPVYTDSHYLIDDLGSVQGVYSLIANTYNSGKARWLKIDDNNDNNSDRLVLTGFGETGGNGGGDNGGNNGGDNGGNDSQKISAELKIVYKYVDIPNSTNSLTFGSISSEKKTLTYGQNFSVNTPNGYETKNLSKLDLPNAEFIGAGLSNIKTSLPVKITYDHLEYSEVVVYFLNAKTIKINGVEYWVVSGSDKLYKYNQTSKTFAEASFNDEALIPTAEGKYFIGWSTTQVSGVCELVNDVIGGSYMDFNTANAEFVVRIIRGGMQSNVTNTAVTGIKVTADYDDIETQKLYAVWGELKLKLNTYAYSVINGTYKPTSFVKVILSPSATEVSNGYKVEINTNYNISLKDKNGDTVQVGAEYGFLNIEWFIGTVVDGVKTPDNTAGKGTLSSTNTAQTTLSAMTKTSNLTVILTPRTDIKFTITTNDYEVQEGVWFSIGDTAITENTRLTYGETYTIKVNDLQYGWQIGKVTSEPETDFAHKMKSFTFTVDFVDEIQIKVTIIESYLNDIIKYGLLALLIGAGATFILALIINTFKPANPKSSKADGEK